MKDNDRKRNKINEFLHFLHVLQEASCKKETTVGNTANVMFNAAIIKLSSYNLSIGLKYLG